MQPLTWLDRQAYPFPPQFFPTEQGRMQYVDVGAGSPIVMVHGTPVWSFVYRALIKDFRRDHRCVAPDMLGYGLSDKPAHADYRPEAHARRFTALVDSLDLDAITLVVHDVGGPVGLAYALAHPEKVRRIVLFNTWMWSLDNPKVLRVRTLLGGPVGRFLYTRLNASPRFLYPTVFGDRAKLDRHVQQHYVQATRSPEERIAMWMWARELVDSAEWYQGLWKQREQLRSIPMLLVWGMKDLTFTPSDLARWQQTFPHAQTAPMPESGHFVQEEAPEAAIAAIRRFLNTD